MPPGSNETDHPRPLILFPHGGPGARDYAEFNPWTQFFASHGWAVLQVNFRGSAGYGDSFLRAGFHRWGLEMQDDLTDGVRWLTAQGIADPERVCIVGAGYGGYAALMGTVKTPDLYRCAVSWAGVTDLQMFVVDQRNYLNKTAAAERSIGRWWEDRQRLKETSPAELADHIRTPVLLAHAEDDRIVFVRHARVMRDALKDAGAQHVEYLEVPYGGHSLNHQESRLAFFDAMERFLVRHLSH
jgi:dipeptidyl aminopeptidase/acylaminoacyl peptidase